MKLVALQSVLRSRSRNCAVDEADPFQSPDGPSNSALGHAVKIGMACKSPPVERKGPRNSAWRGPVAPDQDGQQVSSLGIAIRRQHGCEAIPDGLGKLIRPSPIRWGERATANAPGSLRRLQEHELDDGHPGPFQIGAASGHEFSFEETAISSLRKIAMCGNFGLGLAAKAPLEFEGSGRQPRAFRLSKSLSRLGNSLLTQDQAQRTCPESDHSARKLVPCQIQAEQKP
jgi:hypothetical protein